MIKIKQELYFYIGVCISIVIISSLITYYVSRDYSVNSNGGYTDKTSAPFGLFAGHDVCVKAIQESANGKIITLVSDDRTAKYQAYNSSNQITFAAKVQPSSQPFLSKQRSTVHITFRCTTSAKTNQLLSLSQQIDDIHGIQQQ